ncbi:MAG: OsmC family protein [Alphaproteobacteria bacterium]
MSDPDLLPPSVDPNKKLIGVRKVQAHNDATARTVSTVRDFEIVTDEPTSSNTGQTPLETVLAALLGCEGVIINRCAEAMKFDYAGVDFECEGTVDARGSRGVVGVRPHFQSVTLKVRIQTNEPAERVAKLRKNVESRCPVMNLLSDADVEMIVDWQTVPV